jgi:hypothetical protein
MSSSQSLFVFGNGVKGSRNGMVILMVIANLLMLLSSHHLQAQAADPVAMAFVVVHHLIIASHCSPSMEIYVYKA